MKNLLNEVKVQDQESNLVSWLCYPSYTLVKCDLLVPSFEYDCRVKIRTGEPTLIILDWFEFIIIKYCTNIQRRIHVKRLGLFSHWIIFPILTTRENFSSHRLKRFSRKCLNGNKDVNPGGDRGTYPPHFLDKGGHIYNYPLHFLQSSWQLKPNFFSLGAYGSIFTFTIFRYTLL